MVDFNKFTNYSQEILSSSGALMNEYRNSELQPEHIMLAMIKDNGIIKDYLTELKLLNQSFINKIVAKVKSFPTISGPPNAGQLFLSNDTYRLLDIAKEQSEDLKDEFISIEEMGDLSGRFSYEFACEISDRVPRVYIKDGKETEKYN